MSEHDVETEIYERLYAHPHPDARDGVKKPLLIVDRPLGADREEVVEPVLRDGASRAVGPALVAAGRTAGAAIMAAGRTAGAALMAAARTAGAALLAGARVAGPAMVEAGGKTRRAMGDLGPVVDKSNAAVRRHPAAVGAIVAALIAIPVLALILASAGRSEPANVHLLAPRPAPLLTSPPALPSSARHHAAPSTTTTASQSSAGLPVTSGNQTSKTTTPLRQRSPARVVKPRATHRAAPAKPQPRPAPPIRSPASHERPAKAPTLTTPTTPTAPGGTTTTTTGGAAPGD